MGSTRAIAIDGPAGAGKSTIAKAVGDRLGFLYVDTGAMYRAVALAALRRNADLEDENAMGAVARAIHIDFDATGTRVLLDGKDVSQEIRTPELTAKVRFAARAQPVRDLLVRRQQAIAANRPVIMEGRDITTVVLPDARWKFFLSASAEERATRRLKDLQAAGHDADFDTLLAEIEARDDSDNVVGPMRKAREIASDPTGDITLIDTTGLSPQQVIERIVSHIETHK